MTATGIAKATESQISKVTENQLSVLHRISNIVSSNAGLDEILQEVIALTVQATACDACLVYLLDRGSDEHDLVLRASQLPHKGAIGTLRIKAGEGVTGWVAEHKSPVVLASNAYNDPRFKVFQSLVEDTYEALLSVPLITGGDVIGVINVHHREPKKHTRDESTMLSFIGEQLGVAISRSQLARENERLMEETAEMRRELETRKLVERAKGILQLRYGISEEDAYFRLRNQSRRMRRPMKELAEAIILSQDLSRQPGVQAQQTDRPGLEMSA
ncbi:MAG: GAF domain-containing protein [Bryobacteraceae bacterium]|jgi:uroporphyrinogen-III synthase